MKFNRRTNTVILWVISIGLLLGMIITFTPTLGRLGGRGGGASHGAVELEVNGQPVYEDTVARQRQNPLYSAVPDGPVATDLQLLLTDTLVQNAVLAQASAKVHVGNGEVTKAVDDFRKSRGVAGRKNDQAYLNLIGNAGFTDATFREYVRESLRQSKWEGQLTKDVTVSDAEVQTWYDTHATSYQTDPQILAREIVVDDATQALELQKQAVGGADFAALASKYSKDLADRGGALGAAKGETAPKPVGKPALPTAVATAAFGLKGPGITDVVSAAGQYYIVKVEKYLPAETQPFDKVKDQVKADALKAKQSGVVEQKIDDLVNAAKVTVPQGSSLTYDNPVVAKVGDTSVTAAQLDRAVYTNPQIQQALSPQSATLVTQFFKPAVLGQIIDTYVAAAGAADLKLDLVGTRQMIAQAALNYVARDAKVTQDAMKTYYDSNKSTFTIPAEAEATRIDFQQKAQADAFRKALLAGQALDAAAKADSGTVKDLGTVQPGDLSAELDTALFRTDAFTALPSSKQEMSDVLVLTQPAPTTANGSSTATGSTTSNTGGDAGTSAQPKTIDTYVVLVAVRTPERTRTFAEVQDQVRAAVLANQQQQLRTDWLDKVRKQVKVDNLLAQVEKQQQQAQPSANGSSSGSSSSTSTGSGSAPASSAPSSSGSGGTGSSSSGSSSTSGSSTGGN